MAKQFYFVFGAENPASYTGLSPTFTVFLWNGVTSLAAPSISELKAGSGIYGFQYGVTASIAFVIDGGSTLTNTSIRYIADSIDPVMGIDQSVGFASDSFGSTGSDPSTLLGYAKRNQEFNEGNKVYTKSTGVWDIYSRGSSTLLREKTLVNSSSQQTSS